MIPSETAVLAGCYRISFEHKGPVRPHHAGRRRLRFSFFSGQQHVSGVAERGFCGARACSSGG